MERLKIVVAGIGRVGYYLCQLLIEAGHEVVVIEKDQSICTRLSAELGVTVVQGDSTEAKILELAGTEQAGAFVALTPSDENNLISCLLAKELGAKVVAARVGRVEFDEAEVKKLGIDIVLHPEAASAGYVLELLTKPEMLGGYLNLGKKFEIAEVMVDENSRAFGKRFSDLEYPYGSAIIAVQENDNIVLPDPNSQINVGMKLIIISKQGFTEKIKKLVL